MRRVHCGTERSLTSGKRAEENEDGDGKLVEKNGETGQESREASPAFSSSLSSSMSTRRESSSRNQLTEESFGGFCCHAFACEVTVAGADALGRKRAVSPGS